MDARGISQQHRQLGWHYPQWLNWSFTRRYNLPPTGPTGTAGADPYQSKRDSHSAADESDYPFANRTSQCVLPINFYDTREGETRDANNGCAVNGIMNAVEIDVGNLAKWLKGADPSPATPA